MSDATERRLGLGLGGAAPGGWMAPSVEELAEAIPGLRVLALAGRGGMGAVYRAEQVSLGRVVAVKLLPEGATADPMARERFEREARVLAGLNHPRVLRVFDFGTLPSGASYLVTEWAEGGDLAGRIAGRAQEPKAVAAWVAQIAEALDAAHARGVVHRDLKPANVLVRGDGGLALGDFGLARAEGAGFTTALTLSGVVFGTVDYMAPEQMGANGAGAAIEVTKAADIYALGVMTYQMLTGRVPRGVFEPASRVAQVARAVDEVIAAALAAEPGRRPESAGEFARRLERALAGRGRARSARVALSALAAGVVVAAAVFWPRETGPAGKSPGARVSVQAPAGGKTPVLPKVDPTLHAVRGGWARRGTELGVDGEVGLLRLPVEVPADFRYELVVDFTREAGRNSVGVVLPTAAGTGVFELDAWERGLGGLQAVDGRDLRSNGLGFAASLRNGERQQVHLVVEGTRVKMIWNGTWRGEVELAGRRFSVPEIWGAGEWSGPGLCAWRSPTVFHRVEFRARGEQ